MRGGSNPFRQYERIRISYRRSGTPAPVGSSVYTFQQRWLRSSKSYRNGQTFHRAGWFGRRLNYFLRNIPRPLPSKGPRLANECVAFTIGHLLRDRFGHGC